MKKNIQFTIHDSRFTIKQPGIVLRTLVLTLCIMHCALCIVTAQITLVQFSTGYNAPIDIKNAGDDRLFIVEQGGTIRICDTAGVKKATPYLDIASRLVSGNERGLLGLAFDPNYKTNGFFYVDYTVLAGGPSGATRISRFKVSATNPDSADPSSEKILLTISQPYTNHKGGNVMFGPDGYLYIFMGDGGNKCDPAGRAQNLDSLLGKILRIDVNDTLYKIPADNPFVGKPGRDEIWAYGLRNPFRGSFDRWTGDMWIGDVGQDFWEEIDFEKAGSKGGVNYGWRCYEGSPLSSVSGCNTSGCGPISNYTFPVYEYAHFASYSAVIGGYVYRGAEFSNMFGKYFLSDQYTGNYKFRILTPNGSGGFNVDSSLGSLGRTSIVGFGEDRWGELYVVDYVSNDIYKFKGQNCSPVAFISDSANIYVCDSITPIIMRTPAGKDFHYQWYYNGFPISGSDNDTLLDIGAENYYVVVTNSNGCTATSAPVHIKYPSTLSITGLDTVYCIDNAPIPLVGTPPGGTFSGNGVLNDTLYPDLAGAGFSSITYIYTRPNDGCISYLDQIVHIDECLNAPDYIFLSRFNLYPNPNQGEFTISFYLNHAETLNLEIQDVLGKSVYNKEEFFTAGLQSINIQPGHLAKGGYIFKATNGQQSSTHRFTVQ